jgi:MFS family permease
MSESILEMPVTLYRRMMIKLTIMLITVDVMATAGMVNPAMGAFTKAFPDAGPTLISLIATIITVTMLPVGLLAGHLSKSFNKKTLALIGMAFYIVGGVSPALFSNIYAIIAMRAILGIGAGMLNPLSMSMIRDMYDGKERASMVGYAQAVGSGLIILLQILAGILAAVDYHLAFLAYAPFVLVPILAIIYLPRDPFEPVKTEILHKSDITKPLIKERVPPVVYLLAVVAVIHGIALKFYLIKFAIYFMEEKLGTPAVVGTVIGFMTVGMLLMSLVFGRLYMKARFWTLVMAWGGLVAAILMLYVYPSIITCMIAMFVFGLGFGSIQPFFFMLISVLAPKSQATMALAIFQAGLQFAAFSATFVTAFLLTLMPGASVREQFIAPMIVFGALFLASLIFTIVTKNRSSITLPEPSQEDVH